MSTMEITLQANQFVCLFVANTPRHEPRSTVSFVSGHSHQNGKEPGKTCFVSNKKINNLQTIFANRNR